MQILYCEECQRQISESDLQSGDAVLFHGDVYCRSCANKSFPEQVEALLPKKRPGSGIRQASTSSARLQKMGSGIGGRTGGSGIKRDSVKKTGGSGISNRSRFIY